MAQKKITDLQLIDEVTDELNLPSDDTIQTYRVTVAQLIAYFFSTGRVVSDVIAALAVTTAKLAAGAVTKAKMDATTTVLNNEISNLGLAFSVGSNALTIALKGQDGSDPSATNIVTVAFRHPTITTGLQVIRQITSALSTVISSGSTAGHSSAVAQNLYIGLIDATSLGGGVELCWTSCPPYTNDESQLVSTTAEGGAGAADSNRVIYSTTARASVPVRWIGKASSTQTTAGTWAAVPTNVCVGKFEIEKVKVIYTTNTTQSFDNGIDEVVNYEDKERDNYNAVVTGVNWLFTAPRPGTYQISAAVSFGSTSSWDLTDRLHIRARKNGTDTLFSTWYAPGNINNNARVKGSDAVELAAGDTIDFECEMTIGGGSLSLDGSLANRCSIVEI